MNNRRTFLKKTAGVAGAISFGAMLDPINSFGMKNAFERANSMSPLDVAKDEDFWSYIQQCYTVSTNIVNLNSGGVSPQPKVVQDAFERYNRLCNEGPTYYMWEILDKGREPLRKKLADLAGCSAEEIVINRNTTEALDTVIFGLNFAKGDEVIYTNYCYPNVMNALKQRERRDGIVLKQIKLNCPSESDDALVAAYANAITTKTKLVVITHMLNWNGQLLPAKKIAKVAHDKGAEVLVDGAHSFAHTEYKISDLDCDYFGTSLHKWLCCPFGTGLLYVKKDKIKNVWPLFAPDWKNPKDDGKEVLTMKDGKMFVLKEGKSSPMEKEMTLRNGNKIGTDGTITSWDGTKKTIKNGETIDTNTDGNENDIRKLERLGTRSIPTEQAIGQAIDFHNSIGSKRKEERLRYLKNYWAEKAMTIPGVKIQTPMNPQYSCGLCVFGIETKPGEFMKADEIKTILFDKYKIYSTPIDYEQVHGIRITPNVYTTTKQLDLLVTAIGEIAKDAKK